MYSTLSNHSNLFSLSIIHVTNLHNIGLFHLLGNYLIEMVLTKHKFQNVSSNSFLKKGHYDKYIIEGYMRSVDIGVDCKL